MPTLLPGIRGPGQTWVSDQFFISRYYYLNYFETIIPMSKEAFVFFSRMYHEICSVPCCDSTENCLINYCDIYKSNHITSCCWKIHPTTFLLLKHPLWVLKGNMSLWNCYILLFFLFSNTNPFEKPGRVYKPW